jgi:chromosome segregation ATPase
MATEGMTEVERLRAEVDTASAECMTWRKAASAAGNRMHAAEAEVKRLNYELGVADYPGKNELVRENERLRGIIADLEDELDGRAEVIERLRAQLEQQGKDNEELRVDKSHFAKRAERAENLQRQAEAEVERLRAEVENMERVVGLAQREYADLQHERDTYRAAAMGEENLRKEVEANVKWLQTALAAETADKFKHIAEVKRLNYELGVVDYPGKGALVETNERLRKRLDAANSVWQDEEAALLRIRDGVEKFVADFVKSKPRSSNTVSALRHRELVDWAKRDLERILEGSSDE